MPWKQLLKLWSFRLAAGAVLFFTGSYLVLAAGWPSLSPFRTSLGLTLTILSAFAFWAAYRAIGRTDALAETAEFDAVPRPPPDHD